MANKRTTRVYKGDERFLGGGYLQLVHGKRYICEFEQRRSGKVTAVVTDGFVQARMNYPNMMEFESEWGV